MKGTNLTVGALFQDVPRMKSKRFLLLYYDSQACLLQPPKKMESRRRFFTTFGAIRTCTQCYTTRYTTLYVSMVNTRPVSSQNDNTESARETLSTIKVARSALNIGKTGIVIEFASSTWSSSLAITDNNIATSKKKQYHERVLMINRPRKKHTQHQANHDVAVLTQKFQNISYS